jgi:hypothetical protein
MFASAEIARQSSRVSAPRIRFCLPDERLRPDISSYYFANLPEGPPVHDLMHPEWANIRFTPPPVAPRGPTQT